MVSIIIVNYKVEKELIACVSSILKSKPKVSIEIIVVDNDEESKIETILKEKFPQIKYIKSSGNIGYGAGNNLGVKSAIGEYIFFLNPDTIVNKYAIDILYNFMKNNSNVGMVAPLLLDPLGKVYPYQGSDQYNLISGLIISSFVNKVLPNNPISRKFFHKDWSKKDVEEFDVVPGTAFMIRRSVFEKIKMFDEKFFLYFEEYDLAKRIKKLGYKNYIVPQAKVLHIWGSSTSKRKDINKIFSQSRFYFFKKHFGYIQAFLVELFSSINKVKVVTAFGFLLIILTLLYFHTRGLIYYDEGYILHSAQRMLDGEIPYKDFHFVYTPGSIVFLSLAFRIAGESVLSGRLLMLAISVLTAAIFYAIAGRFVKDIFLKFVPVLLYVFWGPTHINFPWPVMFAICSGLLTCYFFLHAVGGKRNIFYFLAGFATTLTFLFKQNFGFAVFATFLLFFLLAKHLSRARYIKYYLLGVFTLSLLFMLSLIGTNTLQAFVDDFHVYTIRRVLLERTLDTPFVVEKDVLRYFLKLVFYLLPLLLSFLAIYFCWKKRRIYIFLPFLCLFFYFSGIRPTSDYVHLAPLLSITGLPLVVIIASLKSSAIKNVTILFGLGLAILGLYTALFNNYYRWETPLVQNSYFNSNKRVAIWTEHKELLTIEGLQSYIGSSTNPNDYIFANGYFPLVYFLTDRKNPTKLAVMADTPFYASYKEEIIAQLQKKEVKLIVTFEKWQGSQLSDYIKRNYRPVSKINGYLIWKRS